MRRKTFSKQKNGRTSVQGFPLTLEEWKAMKSQFDEQVGSTWPNPKPSERARFTKNAKQTSAVFSHATAVMDKVGGWEEEDWVGSRFAACMWIYAKAVICKRSKNMPDYRLLKFRSIMETVNWVCDDALDDHVWVSELTISCQAAKVLVIEVPCVVQWSMLWFSSPTSLNQRFLDSGTIIEKYNEVVDLAIVATFSLSFGRLHTPRMCFLKIGAGLVSGLLFCLVTGDSEDDLSDESKWRKYVRWMAPFFLK